MMGDDFTQGSWQATSNSNTADLLPDLLRISLRSCFCHPWQLDSGTPCRDDGWGRAGRLHHL